MSYFVDRLTIENTEKWRELIDQIEFIKFDPKYEVKIIPAFGGAMVRFILRYQDQEISVYLDSLDRLGIYGSPYYEIYPYFDDVGRCSIKDIDKLNNMIKESFINLTGDNELDKAEPTKKKIKPLKKMDYNQWFNDIIEEVKE